MRSRAVCLHPQHVVRRCLIVDDNERFLEVAHSSLECEGLEVVGTATTAAEALRKVGELRPDVVLVDIGLGSESGFEVTRQLVADFPDLRARVVLISTRAEEDLEDMIAASPAIGFIRKDRLSVTAVLALLGASST
jgi:DNA-binding NarL/FixJ family response regulator